MLPSENTRVNSNKYVCKILSNMLSCTWINCSHLLRKNMRDSQRSKLYRSENCLRDFEQKFSSFDETIKYARKVLASKWFLNNFSLAIPLQMSGVKLELGAPNRIQSIASKIHKKIIFANSHFDQSTVLHEITHLVTDCKQSHGREFAKNYLKMVKHFMGQEAHAKLKETFKKNSVKYALRRQRKNQPTQEQKQILIERMAKARQARMENLARRETEKKEAVA